MSTTITVATADLRKALVAVGPHAARDPDDVSLYRVRLAVGPENVTVQATNRHSAGLALVSILDHAGELDAIDLSCQTVREVLALFKASKGQPDDEIGDTLSIATTSEELTITDVSGLFPGKALTLPLMAADSNFPNLRKLAHGILTKPSLHVGPTHTERLVTSGGLLSLFKSAASAYGSSLALEMTGRHSALVVACGESFLGFLAPVRQDDEAEAQLTAYRRDWLHRLTDELAVSA